MIFVYIYIFYNFILKYYRLKIPESINRFTPNQIHFLFYSDITLCEEQSIISTGITDTVCPGQQDKKKKFKL